MRRNVLIIGSTSLLGTYLSALRLKSSEDVLLYAASEEEVSSLPNEVRIDEAWWLPENPRPDQARLLLSTVTQLGAAELNCVWEGRRPEVEREVAARCAESGVRHRVFTTALIIDENVPPRRRKREAFFQFLSALYD